MLVNLFLFFLPSFLPDSHISVVSSHTKLEPSSQTIPDSNLATTSVHRAPAGGAPGRQFSPSWAFKVITY